MSTTTGNVEAKVSSKSKRIIDETVKRFTDKDIRLIADSCYKLRSLNNKKGETRREFVGVSAKHHDTYRKVLNTYNDLALSTSDNKKYILGYYVQLIRGRQEDLGIKDYLLNEVKFGFMKSIVKWIDTPGELDKVSSISSQGKKGSTKKQKKSQESATKVNLKLINKKSSGSAWQVQFSITNVSKQPLQNIDLYFYDDENNILSLSEASGDYITLLEEEDCARIDFLMASMDENDQKAIDYLIKASKDENFENLSKIEVVIENPSKGEKEKQEFYF